MTRPELRGVVTGPAAVHRRRSFILVRKSNAPKGPKIGALGGDLLLELNVLDGQDRRVMTVPDSHRPTHGSTSPKCPRQGHRLHHCPETGTQGPHGCDSGVLRFDCLVLESAGRPWSNVAAGHARKCAKLPAFPPGGGNSDVQSIFSTYGS